MDCQSKIYSGLKSCSSGDVFEPTSKSNGEAEAKQRATLIQWLNIILPNYGLPTNASDEELRTFLVDGTILCQILNRLRPGSVSEWDASNHSSEWRIKRFIARMDEMGMPKFQISDLQKGPMKIVLECLLTLKEHSGVYHLPNMNLDDKTRIKGETSLNYMNGGDGSPRVPAMEDWRKGMSDSKFQRALRSPVMEEESSPAMIHHVGHKFHQVFQTRQGYFSDLPAAKLSEMMKSNSLDNAPTQSLLSVVNGILDESIERKNAEIPHRVACLLRKVVQEIERRISTQAEHLRTQNSLFKAREEKYQSRIRVLEALATGTSQETEIVMNQLQQIKTEKNKIEEKKKVEEEDVVRLLKEKDRDSNEITELKQELEIVRKTHEEDRLEIEAEAKKVQQELEEKLKEVLQLLSESRRRVTELEAFSESKCQGWNKKEHIYQIFMELNLGALQELRVASKSIRKEIFGMQKSNSDDFNRLGKHVKALQDAAENYYAILAENQKLHNELQELKGNIRVYCRIRPFLPGQMGKQTTIEYIGEHGELVIVNPSKLGKDGRRSFQFNKVYGPAITQEEVYSDTQPLIQSVLDGYNVCIFAYGQTGSGKTYTMSGPEGASEVEWGVNYRALNDLFRISQARVGTFIYEIVAQMVEIYNEQVRDLLSSDGSQKRLGILSASQPNGLAVPDASMYTVESTSDVLELMDIGLKNRAKGATALNERSSRSHSILTIHVRGIDMKSGSSLRGSLNLVDLAGSERVDRSEVAGERLREAQHINKSLSALGDVIFALAQKSPHVPYRNSKLTQLLQTSLGGQAKTLMFVQLNPEVSSYSETVSTLKFAERASGVELGAAKSSKDSRDVRELMDQVSSLKDTIAKKDEEIERLQLLKDLKNVFPGMNGEKRPLKQTSSSSSPRKSSASGAVQRSIKLFGGDDNYSESSDKHSVTTSSQQSVDDFKHQKEPFHRSNMGEVNFHGDAESIGYGDVEYEQRLSDVSDGGLSMGTDPEISVESNILPIDTPKSTTTVPRVSNKSLKDTSTGLLKSASGKNISAKTAKRWQ